MMILLIIARWLMPKGDLTRDQLSALLLYYLGTASDIVDFFSVLSEGDDLLLNNIFIYTILNTWVWSMFQFVFVVTMTAGGDDDNNEEQAKGDDKAPDKLEKGNFHKSTEFLVDPKKKDPWWKRLKRKISSILASEARAIAMSMAFQDGPFAVVRLVCLFYWQIRTYTNYFFTFKNVLVLFLQIYRLVAVYEEYKKSKKQDEEQHKEELHEHLKNATMKARALTALTGGFKKRKVAPEEILEYSSEEEETEIEDTEVEETENEETDYETTHRSDTTGSMTPVSC